MKKKYISIAAFLAISMGVIYTGNSSTQKVHDNNGRYGKTGSPGETTCTDSKCHGSGQAGGLAVNKGAGSVSITSSPAFVNNTYIPGQVYTISITIEELGKAAFGFDFEALDNSGNTATTTNNAVGIIGITNGTLTKTGVISALAKRVGVTHKTVIKAANQGVFQFNWTAPSTTPTGGFVNMYAAGNAANNDNVENAADNIYTTTLKLSPAVTAIDNSDLISKYDLSIYPNPVLDHATLKIFLKENATVAITITDIDGKEVQIQNFEGKNGNNSFDLYTSSLSKGSYFAKILIGNDYMSYKIIKK